jgi:transcriptional regulator with XRE-family HTH domain
MSKPNENEVRELRAEIAELAEEWKKIQYRDPVGAAHINLEMEEKRRLLAKLEGKPFVASTTTTATVVPPPAAPAPAPTPAKPKPARKPRAAATESKPDKKIVGKRLREAREACGIKARDLSRVIGAPFQTISQSEGGFNSLNATRRALVCAQLNLREEWLLTGNGEMWKAGGPHIHKPSEARTEPAKKPARKKSGAKPGRKPAPAPCARVTFGDGGLVARIGRLLAAAEKCIEAQVEYEAALAAVNSVRVIESGVAS